MTRFERFCSRFNWQPDRVAAGLGLTLGALFTLAVYAWLTAGAATPREREECHHVPYPAADRGGLCFIIRRLPAPR